MKTQKKMIVITMITVFVFIMTVSALCEHAAWDCPECGRKDNTGKFCGGCGYPVPTTNNGDTSESAGNEFQVTEDDMTSGVYPQNSEGTDQTSIESGNWPVRTFYGTGITVNSLPNDKNVKRQAYLGPNAKVYASGGSFKASAIQNSVALFREGEYALVDFYYPTMGRYCVYFLTRYLSGSDIEQVALTAYPAQVISEVYPMEGPGSDYRKLEELTAKRNIKEIVLMPGTRIDVFFEINGWLFSEFSCSIGRVRAWIPVNSVKSI